MKTTFWDRMKQRFLGITPTPQEGPKEIPEPAPKAQSTPVDNVIQSRRNDDMSAEAQLACFLDTYLYNRFPQSDSFSRIERMHNKTDQLAGVDVRFTGKDGTVYDVDEKAQLYYLNKNLPTFAFEIQFLREGRPTIGWLCNNSLKTDLYLLIWPFATQDTPRDIRWHQFAKADCLLIQKKRLLAMLEREGLTIERMQREAAQLRANGHTGKVTIDGVRGIYYFASDPQRYREAPINIVVAKDRLRSIAQRRYIVTKESVEVQ
jgi:hypothetical protein